jgi:hypothetical protein
MEKINSLLSKAGTAQFSMTTCLGQPKGVQNNELISNYFCSINNVKYLCG